MGSRNELIWLRIRLSGGLLEHCKVHIGSIKGKNFFKGTCDY
jgi:hypothetical protein